MHVPYEVKAFVSKVKMALKPEKMLLFGSRATGKARPDSDYDILIVSNAFKKTSPHKRATRVYLLHDGAFALEVICLTPDEFDALKRRPSIVQAAVKEGILLAET